MQEPVLENEFSNEPGNDEPEKLRAYDDAILTHTDLDEAISNGAVGDIANRFINANGQPIQAELNDRIIGIDLKQLHQIPRVVGVAGDTNKIAPIRAVLQGKLIDVLITDQTTSEALVEE